MAYFDRVAKCHGSRGYIFVRGTFNWGFLSVLNIWHFTTLCFEVSFKWWAGAEWLWLLSIITVTLWQCIYRLLDITIVCQQRGMGQNIYVIANYHISFTHQNWKYESELKGLCFIISLQMKQIVLTVRNMRGLQYIGAGLQYIGAPEFYFQDSGKEWRGRVLIKPGFVYHIMV